MLWLEAYSRFASEKTPMAIERRRHPRYKPVSELKGQIYWHCGAELVQDSAQVVNLSQGGCSLLVGRCPPEANAVVLELSPTPAAPALKLPAQVTGRSRIDDSWLISLCFQHVSPQQERQLSAALLSGAYQEVDAQSAATYRKHWRAEQWAAYLTAQQLPVMARSKAALVALEAQGQASGKELAGLADGDPFLCLCLLREAENRRSSRLGHETTTPLAAVMQLGETAFRELLFASPETDEANHGLAACESRAVTAGRLAAAWSRARADISPDELVMAALLSEVGELMLWHFAPELPQAALEALASGESQRSAMAQELACGFKFKDLTLKCAEIWKLPVILVQLIRGTDSARANLARLCIDTARHVSAGNDNSALPDDLAGAKLLMPNASLEWLAARLVGVPEDGQKELVALAALALERMRQESPGHRAPDASGERETAL